MTPIYIPAAALPLPEPFRSPHGQNERIVPRDVDLGVLLNHVVKHVLDAQGNGEAWEEVLPDQLPSGAARNERLSMALSRTLGKDRCGVADAARQRSRLRTTKTAPPPCHDCPPPLRTRCAEDLSPLSARYAEVTSEILRALPDMTAVRSAELSKTVLRASLGRGGLEGLSVAMLGWGARGTFLVLRINRWDGVRVELRGDQGWAWRTTYRQRSSGPLRQASFLLESPGETNFASRSSGLWLASTPWWEGWRTHG